MTSKKTKDAGWVAVVGINHNTKRYNPGDPVPTSWGKKTWLVQGGKIRKADS
jgi:hypothetical protein